MSQARPLLEGIRDAVGCGLEPGLTPTGALHISLTTTTGTVMPIKVQRPARPPRPGDQRPPAPDRRPPDSASTDWGQILKKIYRAPEQVGVKY